MDPDISCDIVIVGGGLAGGLAAMALAATRPELRVILLERDGRLGGNHIWSFFDGDLGDAGDALVAPLVTHRWPGGHDVHFSGRSRTLSAPYNSIASADFDAHLVGVLGERAMTGVDVASVAPDSVTLADGRRIAARAVIDARGAGDLSVLECGWQKFVGAALRLSSPHGLERPVIMDARVPQMEGYRFVYLLPWDSRTVFVEDTYYSDGPDLPQAEIEERIATYALAQGWMVEEVVHREAGVLPVVFGGDFDRYWPADDRVGRIGVRAGLFHPLTGYSLPDAVGTALWLAGQPIEGLADALRARAAAHWRSGSYYRFLTRMLFEAAESEERWRVFARFYGLGEPLIGRFYAGRSTPSDRLRILCGRPPVPIRSAMRALRDHFIR